MWLLRLSLWRGTVVGPLRFLSMARSPQPPPAPPSWTVLETEELQDCAVFTVSRALARSPRTGRAHPFFRIDSADWVNVVPVTEDDEIVLIRQYRHGAREVTLEIPGGLVDPGESPAEAGARELLEETGFRAASLEPIGVVNPNPALFGNRVYSFLARGAVRVGEIRGDGLEETVVELVPRLELEDRLRAGAIDHALVVAALYWYRLSGGEPA